MSAPHAKPHERVLSRDEMRLIAEIGHCACAAGNAKDGQAIFEGLLVLAPEQTFGYIGLAMSRMSVGDHNSAVRILRDQGLPAVPDEDDLQVFLGLALLEARETAEGRRVLGAVLAKDKPDSADRRFAQALLRLASRSSGPAAQPAAGLPRPAAMTHGHYI